MSSNAGGLIRWPVKLTIPVGATLLALQGFAEIVKRIGYLRGQYTMDTHYGLAEDLLEGTGQLFGSVPGGLAFAVVVVVGAILGAITGTVAASVIAMGMIALPIMMRYGYDMKLATGVIAASGTITQLIPTSVVLIVLADQLSKSFRTIRCRPSILVHASWPVRTRPMAG